MALTALFVALGGTSIAAVNFARNAGAVNGKSAVSSSATLGHAAGRLVATAKAGPHRGQLPGKFLAQVARTIPFGKAFAVVDNAQGAPVTLASEAGFGTLSANCTDGNSKKGVLDPRTAVTFANQSTQALNTDRQIGAGNPAVSALAPGTAQTLTLTSSNTFVFHVQSSGGVEWIVEGAVRQDRAPTGANCLVYGTVLRAAR